MSQQESVPGADLFRKQAYMNLTTFRKNGQPVTTPVWFAQAGETLYVYTGMESGKIKRIRRDGAVQIGPCTARGKPLGPVVPGQARIITGSDAQRADMLITTKYGWQKKVAAFFNSFRKAMSSPAFIEIRLGGQ